MCNCMKNNVGRPVQQPAFQAATPVSTTTVRGRALMAQQAAVTVRSNAPYVGRPKVFNNTPILR